VAEEVGAETLDGLLSSFYQANVGQAAGMQDMLDAIAEQTGFDPSELAQGWLLSLERPDL
jgi:aminopeptidase N